MHVAAASTQVQLQVGSNKTANAYEVTSTSVHTASTPEPHVAIGPTCILLLSALHLTILAGIARVLLVVIAIVR